eukprot:TRINITY_DN588_c0_g1_i3.p1 TRINITY_DN588_c0_g1~~TRINITY_DN588_c0_g1_i3.p1  ORF type:complete len:186 (-),score=36.88 TRINITY_DN588_c0_g1_i3:159-716(-)
MMLAVDSSGCLTHWSEEAERLSSFTQAEVVGLPLLEFITCPFREQVNVVMSKVQLGTRHAARLPRGSASRPQSAKRIVYPILAAVMRRQLFGGLLGRPELGPRGMALYGLALVGLTTTVSAVYPKPGSVVGYVGTYTAVVYVLWLPILVHLAAVRKSGQRLGLTLLLHGGMAVVGTVVLLMQFVV